MSGPAPVHVPGSAATVSPTRGEPVTDGAVWWLGAAPVTRAVGVLVADAAPAPFVAVTLTWRRLSASAAPGVYVGSVAPGMSAHVVVWSQRSHW